MYMLTFTSSPYFCTAGRARISSRQDSHVSPAVMRRSRETAQESATAQRLGEVKKISDTVMVPRPRKLASSQSLLYFLSSIFTRPLIFVSSAASFSFRARTS